MKSLLMAPLCAFRPDATGPCGILICAVQQGLLAGAAGMLPPGMHGTAACGARGHCAAGANNAIMPAVRHVERR